MDVVNAILKPVAEALMVPVKRHLGYFISSTKHVRDMCIKMRVLDAAKDGVEEHMKRNISNRLEVPAQVTGWLEEVEKINAKVENIPSEAVSCLKVKTRHNLGRKALEMIDEIQNVMTEHSLITWTDHPIPVGRVGSKKASTSTPSTTQPDDFPSREQTFTKALKALQPNHKSHMIALWGMGGVGKTTMMQRLKKVAKENKMFNFIMEAVVGQKTDPIAVQQAVADYFGIELKESTKPARADKLRQWFETNSDGGKIKFLIILDDVWQSVDLNDIGLSPLPNQGVDFKVLLTSRNKDVCTEMGVEANSILHVQSLIEPEAQSLFRQFVENFDDVDPGLYKIGEHIVRKCCGLPIAIKTMACTLRNKSKDAWKDALSRLEHHDIHNVVNDVFEMSYDNLQDEETKSVFLLCGLFPEDFNIPTEELVRYGWGLKLFKKVHTIREARTRLNTCIERLMDTNLLIKSDDVGCIKMHDLALAFVLDMFSKVEHASVVDHGSMSGWPENDMNASCKRISFTCKGISEFPRDLKFPNLLVLKLMHGKKSLTFPQDFYVEMEKLQVISYDCITHPLLPSSLQCSINLRVLHLNRCSLMFDCSSIGTLLNLEVLSFAYSDIAWLPSIFGNLKKLRLLDLTDCRCLRIDNGVLKNLVKLEELYMVNFFISRQGPCLTDNNYNEMAERSKNLSALEFHFFENNAQLKNMSFENLERFNISSGVNATDMFCTYTVKSRNTSKNTLKLVTTKGEILESRIYVLFEKTEVLCLRVEDMNDLSDVEVKISHPLQSSSFHNLRVLVVSRCVELRYLFTLGIAKALSNLEHLKVESCHIMEALIHTSESNREETMKFPKLKFLYLHHLSQLSSFCHNDNIVELPQLVELSLCALPNFTSIYPKDKFTTSCLLKEEVVITMLEKLCISDMENLKEIWPYEFRTSEEVKLTKIVVDGCDNLVNLFPCNPMPLLRRLEELTVMMCGSIEALFNIDFGEFREGVSSSRLRSIYVRDCNKLVNMFPCNPMPFLHHLEDLEIQFCGSIEVLFNINFVEIGKEGGSSSSSLRSIKVNSCNKLVNLFPCNPMSLLHHLEVLEVEYCGSIEVLFDIDLDSIGEIAECSSSSSLRNIKVNTLGNLSEMWRIKGANHFGFPFPVGLEAVETIKITHCKNLRNFVTDTTSNFDPEIIDCGIPGRSHDIVLKLPNLKVLDIAFCNLLVHIFTFSTLGSLGKLEELKILRCAAMKVIVKEEHSGEQTTASSKEVVVFPRLKSIQLKYLEELVGFFLGKNEFRWSSLDDIVTTGCPQMMVFTSGPSTAPKLKYIHTTFGKYGLEPGLNFHVTTTAHRQTVFQNLEGISSCSASSEGIPWHFHNVIELDAKDNSSADKIIPSSQLLHLQKLEKIHVNWCYKAEVVFEALVGTDSGFDESQTTVVKLPNLRQVELNGLSVMRYIWKSNQWTSFAFPNLTRVHINDCGRLEHVFTRSMVGSLLQLQELHISHCKHIEEVIVKDADGVAEKAQEESDGKMNEIMLPCLKSLLLNGLPCLKGFWLGKEEFSWPLLDTLTIKNCTSITVFTTGNSATPELKEIETSFGSFHVAAGEDINSFIKIKQQAFKNLNV